MCWTFLSNNYKSTVKKRCETCVNHNTRHMCARVVLVGLTHMQVGCWDSTHRSGLTWRFSSIRAKWSCSPPGVWSSGSSSRTASGPWEDLPLAGGTGGPDRPPYLWSDDQQVKPIKPILHAPYVSWQPPQPAFISSEECPKSQAKQATEASPLTTQWYMALHIKNNTTLWQ